MLAVVATLLLVPFAPTLVAVMTHDDVAALETDAVAGNAPLAPTLGVSGAVELRRDPRVLVQVRALDPALARYAELRIDPGSSATIAATLRTKMKRLTQLERALALLASRRDPDGIVAACVRIGDLYWNMADTLDTVPVPVSDEMAPYYRAAIAEYAAGIRERAREVWQRASLVVREADADAAEGAALQERLARVTP